MRYHVPALPALHAFEAAARHESFAAAANELNVTQAAVSHRVRLLENELGCKLFERRPRKLVLTEMGKAYLPPVRKAFDGLSISTAGLFGPTRTRARSLKIRAPISFATLWLAPRLDGFSKLYPDIDLRLNSSIWAEKMPGDDMDIEIRFGHGLWDGYNAERISSEIGVPVCSPETRKAVGHIRKVSDLTSVEPIYTLSLEDLWQRMFRLAALSDDAMPAGVVVDSTMAALELAAASRRFAIAPTNLLAPYLESRRLVVALDTAVPIEPANHLLTPTTSQAPKPEVLLFREWLLKQAAQQASEWERYTFS